VTAQLPLAGVRVLAVEQFGAGPWCTLQLASLGATVIKVEDPGVGGDVGRYVMPFQEGESSLFFETFNRGKSSLSLDLRHDRAPRVLRELVAECDVVFSNLRGDLPSKLGLDYAALGDANEAIVCCSLSGFGMSGPRAALGAYDYAIQGHAGWMSVTGEPDGPPVRAGLSLVDFSAGFAAAVAILAGLHQARSTGRGCDCDLSLFEVALGMTNYLSTWSLSRDWRPERIAESAHPSVVPFQLFPTGDGWIVICCAKDSLFARLCQALALSELIEDERFATLAARRANRDACVAALTARLREGTTAAWIEVLEAAAVPCGPVNDIPQAFLDPQVAARDGVDEYEHPELGTVRTAALPIRVGSEREEPRRAPYRGEHTRSLLRDLTDLPEAEIDELGSAGVFGSEFEQRSGGA
jgi:crotonobetainyl-CoA:carnitine CoA-transferase CaiB-like acyl-CoA transferase